MFTEIYCLKNPHKCMELLQYSSILNNLSGKFPFSQVYMYDKKFRLELQQVLSIPWNIIDMQLWSPCLHGVNMLAKAARQQQQGQQQCRRTPRLVWPFPHCFTHSRGGYNHPSCSFPHICGWCRMYSHVTGSCPLKSGNSAGGNSHQGQQMQQQQNNSRMVSNQKAVHPPTLLKEPLITSIMCSPVGLMPNRDSTEMRMIMHLSVTGCGLPINDHEELGIHF